MEKAEDGSHSTRASGYRQLCKSDTAGKLFERLICRRLEVFGFYLVSGKRISMNAIEMVMAKSMDAISGERRLEGDKVYCGIITFYVKNAFHSAASHADCP